MLRCLLALSVMMVSLATAQERVDWSSLEERFERAYQEVIQAAQKIKDAWVRSQALKDIALALAKAGQLDQAIQIAKKVEDARVRSWVLNEIALALAKVGETERANQTFYIAIQTAKKIEDASVRSRAPMDIVEALIKVGRFDCAVEVAETIDEPIARLQALAAIVAAKRKAGKGEAGKR